METATRYDILFAIMAVREVLFFAPIAKKFMEGGLRVAFLTFHEAGDDILERDGIPYFSLHKIKRSLITRAPRDLSESGDIEKRLGVNVEHIIFHEMHMSGRRRQDLISKAVNYCSLFDDLLQKNEIGCVVQELGGYIAPLALYYASRTNNVNHVFIEPAMFRKRVVFTLNNLYADIPRYGTKVISLNDDVKRLLDEYMTQKTVVIPTKDRHFFLDMTFRRLFSSDNFKRLSRKLYYKYLLGQEEEYNWILQYITMHIVRSLRRKVLSFYYTKPAAGDRYVYYPFHVPLDVQLTARCPDFFEQEFLVGKIADSIPEGYKLYIKEHPAAIGGHSLGKLKKILSTHDNVRLIHPGQNSFDIIKKADCIISVNSKVGFEAIIQGKPVIVLGKTFYRGKGLTFDVMNIQELPMFIKQAVSTPVIDENARESFLAQAFTWSYKGELYVNRSENLDDFYCSLMSFLKDSGIIREHTN